MLITTFDEKKGKDVTCGYTEGKTYFRDVKMEHMMIKYFGFGVQAEVLERLLKMGIESIVLKTKKKSFKSALADWARFGKLDDFGHGRQVFLSMKYMEE
jgi:hypothetical protein